jgi:hypothetical protein
VPVVGVLAPLPDESSDGLQAVVVSSRKIVRRRKCIGFLYLVMVNSSGWAVFETQ